MSTASSAFTESHYVSVCLNVSALSSPPIQAKVCYYTNLDGKRNWKQTFFKTIQSFSYIRYELVWDRLSVCFLADGVGMDKQLLLTAMRLTRCCLMPYIVTTVLCWQCFSKPVLAVPGGSVGHGWTYYLDLFRMKGNFLKNYWNDINSNCHLIFNFSRLTSDFIQAIDFKNVPNYALSYVHTKNCPNWIPVSFYVVFSRHVYMHLLKNI